MAGETQVETTSSALEPSRGQQLLSRGIVACYAIALILAVQAVTPDHDLWGVICFLGGAAYFRLAPSRLRKGDKKARMMIGVLSVLLALFSLGGVSALFSQSNRIWGALSSIQLLFSAYLVFVFGYSQVVVAHLAKVRHNPKGSSDQ